MSIEIPLGLDEGETTEPGAAPAGEPGGDITDDADEARRDLSAIPVIPRDRYPIKHEFARGLYTRVFIARDPRLERDVAIKELRTTDKKAQSRFLRRVLITAQLQDHPAIVPIYEMGRWPSGELICVMKLISGSSLSELLARCCTLEERLSLLPHLIAAADAIAYAHDHSVIHRDMKPRHIFIGPRNETLVLGWTLAKVLCPPDSLSDGPLAPIESRATTRKLTEPGSILGTPQYIPPEQGRGETADERADVYTLGATLYHLLADAPPYSGGSAIEVLERVQQGPPIPIAQRVAGVPKDLAAIVGMAMGREPLDRYPTAHALLEDLRRFQAGQRVSARGDSRIDRLGHWLRRHLGR